MTFYATLVDFPVRSQYPNNYMAETNVKYGQRQQDVLEKDVIGKTREMKEKGHTKRI